jgi:hypothetical protein
MQLGISLRNKFSLDTELQDFFNALIINRYKNLAMDLKPKTLRLFMNESKIMCLVSFNCLQRVLEAPVDADIRRLMFAADRTPLYDSQLLWSIMWEAIPRLGLRGLMVHCTDLAVEFSWTSVFRCLHDLEWVELMYAAATVPFVAALKAAGAPKEPGNGQDTDSIVLPSLRSLSLLRIKFEDDNHFDDLINCLTIRNQRGYRLRRLYLSRSWDYMDHLDKWREVLSPLVDELVVDESSRYCDDGYFWWQWRL